MDTVDSTPETFRALPPLLLSKLSSLPSNPTPNPTARPSSHCRNTPFPCPHSNQPENTPSEHCTARSLPALPVTVAQTRRSDDPQAISATDFITKIINISQNRTKYATTTSNFFLSLDQQRRYTQRTSTTTTGTDSHWMAGASPHQHYQARLYFLHLTLLHFSALSLFSLDVRSSSTLASSVLYTTLCVHTTTPHQYHQRFRVATHTQRFDSSNPASCSLYPRYPPLHRILPFRSHRIALTPPS